MAPVPLKKPRKRSSTSRQISTPVPKPVSRSSEANATLQAAPEGDTSRTCAHCSQVAKSRHRNFSEQAWQVLIIWNEIVPKAVKQSICDQCYEELRDILIDRTDEIEATLQRQGASSKPKKKASKLAS